MRYSIVGVCALGLLAFWAGNALAEDQPQRQKDEWNLGIYGLGLIPATADLTVGGTGIANNDLKSAYGAGIKGSFFPKFADGILGFEAELFGHGGQLRAPSSGLPLIGGAATSATADLVNINLMFNVIARYPGEVFQPYAGGGFGISRSEVKSANINVNFGSLVGDANDTAFAYQFLVGTRAYVGKKVYLFTEYKFFGSNYSYKTEGTGNPTTKLDLLTHIFSGGIGYSF